MLHLLILVLSFNLWPQDADLCRSAKIYYSLEEALQEPDSVRVLDLAMQNPKLTTIPPEVCRFTNLECLDVSFNRIGSVPDSIGNLIHLKHLNMAGNRYLAKFPEALTKLDSLQVVDFTAIPEWSDEKCMYAKAQLPHVRVLTDK